MDMLTVDTMNMLTVDTKSRTRAQALANAERARNRRPIARMVRVAKVTRVKREVKRLSKSQQPGKAKKVRAASVALH